MERLNHSVQFSHPTPDYISTTAAVKHYKPYNMIIVCSNSVGTPLTALDMLYEDDEEYLVGNVEGLAIGGDPFENAIIRFVVLKHTKCPTFVLKNRRNAFHCCIAINIVKPKQ